jgi:hypothetical protein
MKVADQRLQSDPLWLWPYLRISPRERACARKFSTGDEDGEQSNPRIGYHDP